MGSAQTGAARKPHRCVGHGIFEAGAKKRMRESRLPIWYWTCAPMDEIASGEAARGRARQGMMGTQLMRVDGTSRELAQRPCKRLMPSPSRNERRHTQPERADKPVRSLASASTRRTRNW